MTITTKQAQNVFNDAELLFSTERVEQAIRARVESIKQSKQEYIKDYEVFCRQ